MIAKLAHIVFFNSIFPLKVAILLLLAMMVGTLLSFGQQDSVAPKPLQRDRIYLVNGSFLEGRLKSMDRGQFVFKADKLTTVNIDKRNVATLVTPLSPLRVDMINGTVYYGHFSPLPNSGTAFIKTGETDSSEAIGRVLNLVEIETIRLDNPNFFKNVQGEVAFGLSYNRSSNILRTNLSNSITYNRHRMTFQQSSNGINTLSDTAASWERFSAALIAVYKMKNKWRAAAILEYQRMLELGITSRIIQTDIIGYPVINTPKVSVMTLSGLSISKEFRIDGTKSNLQLELPLQIRLDVFKMSHNDFTVTSSSTLYKGISVADRFRIDHSTVLGISVYKDLKVSLEFFINYDSKPSAENVSNADYGTVLGLGYTF